MNWRSGHCFIDVGTPVSDKVKLSSSGDDDSSDGDPQFSSDDDGCSSEAEQDCLSTSKQSRWSDLEPAALADIQRRGQIPRQDSGRSTHALDHVTVQSQISFLPQVGRTSGQALRAYRLVTTHSNWLQLFLRMLRTKDRMWFMKSSICATPANTYVLKSHV